ncbi:MAG TPA: hypothetical protein VL332_02090 [Candidatus Saccharimonadaceae bacterium]|nr:hypothetical protein [Candidatus Saccharimonadaceae bacterium]
MTVPERLELKDGCLCYQYFPNWLDDASKDTRQSRSVTPPPRLVDHFVRLVDAPEEDILAFAKRWGVLDLCSHGKPMIQDRSARQWSHGPAPGCAPLLWNPPGLEPRLSGFWIGRERLAHWRQWARRARALMRIAAAVAGNRPGGLEDWIELKVDEATPERLEERRANIAKQGALLMLDKFMLHSTVNQWVEVARMGPKIVAGPNDPPVIRFASSPMGNLFGLLGLQMMVRITRVGSLAVCTHCGSLYKPDRLPNPKRRNFCSKCGRQAAMKLAKRAMMERKSKALALHKSGMRASDVASAVGSRASTVRRWFRREKG